MTSNNIRYHMETKELTFLCNLIQVRCGGASYTKIYLGHVWMIDFTNFYQVMKKIKMCQWASQCTYHFSFDTAQGTKVCKFVWYNGELHLVVLS